jgi:hypothetical protein
MLPAMPTESDRRVSRAECVAICQKATDRLQGSAYLALRDVRCELDSGVLCLRGRVRTQFLKQVAQTQIFEISGALRIENQIEIDRKDVAPRGYAMSR